MHDCDKTPDKETIERLRKRNRRKWDLIISSIFLIAFVAIAGRSIYMFHQVFGRTSPSLAKISTFTHRTFPDSSHLIHSISYGGPDATIMAEIEMDRTDAEKLLRTIQPELKRLDDDEMRFVNGFSEDAPKWWDIKSIADYRCAKDDHISTDYVSGYCTVLFIKPGTAGKATIYLWYRSR